jgi:uncharacterized membrane protein YagU involved in acid resistance
MLHYHVLGLVRSHLIVIDGAFAWRLLKKEEVGKAAHYTAGTIIHLGTSLIFGLIYVVIAGFLKFEPQSAVSIALYVFALWLAMLGIALPIAGQGFLGRKIGPASWLEQAALHAIFGLVFWWSLGTF